MRLEMLVPLFRGLTSKTHVKNFLLGNRGGYKTAMVIEQH
jgi:hypothetical protein